MKLTSLKDLQHVQRHLAEGVGRAREARVIAADDRLHPVEHRLRDRLALHVVAGDLDPYAAADRLLDDPDA